MADETMERVINTFPASLNEGVEKIRTIMNDLPCSAGDALAIYLNTINLVTKRYAYEEQAKMMEVIESRQDMPTPIIFPGAGQLG